MKESSHLRIEQALNEQTICLSQIRSALYRMDRTLEKMEKLVRDC